VIQGYSPKAPRDFVVSFQKIDYQDPDGTLKDEKSLQPRGALNEVGKGDYRLCFRSKNMSSKIIEIGFSMHVESLRTRANRNTKMSNTDTYNPDVYRHINKNKEKKEKSKEDEISTVDDEDDDTGSAIEMSMERMIEMAARLNEHMSSLEDRRVFVKQMAAIARDLSEDTFTRVIRWNVLEMIVVIMVAAGQVFYFKSRFNNQKRYF